MALKKATTTTPILAMLNFNEPFTIETNASGDSIGAILSQQARPVAHMSCGLGVNKISWSVYAKEMLAILEAVWLWRPYLLSSKFFIHIEQHSLKHLLEQCIINIPEQKKIGGKLLGHDYKIQYRLGHENATADVLSRKAESPVLYHFFCEHVNIWDDIQHATQCDPDILAKKPLSNLAVPAPMIGIMTCYFRRVRWSYPM